MWLAIAEDLERAIHEGVLGPGDKLPTEHMLVRKYFVTRHMVRLAINRLIQRGLVESHQGRGTFVCRPNMRFPIRHRTRFGEIAQQAHVNHKYETRSIQVGRMPSQVAREFGVKLTALGVCLERVSIVDGQPSAIAQHYFLEKRVPRFVDTYGQFESVTDTLKELGITDYVRVRTHILSRLPTSEEAGILQMPRHVPLIITRSINHDVDGNMLEYGEARMAADRMEIVIDTSNFNN
jgi:GntR family transcriptional regulator, phosphonate transport system regulatory protein